MIIEKHLTINQHNQGTAVECLAACTALSKQQIKSAMQKGAVDFIQKPFRDQDLLDRIRDALETDEMMDPASKDSALETYEAAKDKVKEEAGEAAAEPAGEAAEQLKEEASP